MRNMLLALFVLAVAPPILLAQGSQVIGGEVSGGTNLGNQLAIFEVTSHAAVTMRRVGISQHVAGTFDIEVWTRPGLLGTAPPQQPPLSGWTKLGAVNMHADNPGEIVQVPLDLDEMLGPNESISIALVRTFGQMRFYHGSAVSSPVPSNAHLTLNNRGYIGSYLPGHTPSFSTYYGMAMAFSINVWYDAGPTVHPTKTALALPNTPVGNAGQALSYNLHGFQLSGATSILAPAGVEISFNETFGYASALQVNAFPDYQRTVYARLKNGTAAGFVSGKISHSSAGATTTEVDVSGYVVSMYSSTTSLNFGVAPSGNPGTPHSYVLNAAGLTHPTLITAPAGFEIATNAGGPYSTSLQLAAAAYSQTVFVRLTGAAVGVYLGSVTHTSGIGTFNVAVSGEVVPPYDMLATRNGPHSTLLVDNDSAGVDGHLLLDFTVEAFLTPWNMNSITFTSFGGIGPEGFSSLALYEDNPAVGTAGVFDGSGVDLLATSAMGTTFNGGTYTATLNNETLAAFTPRRFFLRGTLAGKARVDQAIRVEVGSIAASSTGPGAILGVPTVGTQPALTIFGAHLMLIDNGPHAWTAVTSNSQGDGGNGHVISDITIRPQNNAWTVTNLLFTETGTIHAQNAVNFLALYLDNGNGVWDGPTVDSLATLTPIDTFTSANGTYQAILTPQVAAFGVNEAKRFFLVCKLNGTATPAQTLRVSMTSMGQLSSSGGDLIGVPSPASQALVVELATLSIAKGPYDPGVVSRIKSDVGFTQVLGSFRLMASLGDFTVGGFKLTTEGTGMWASSLDATTGIQILLDDGNGSVDAGDTLLFSGGGGFPSVQCDFSQHINLTIGTHADLWVVINVLPNVGSHPGDTFQARIASASDVQLVPVGGFRALSTQVPVTGLLRVVDFSVTEFTPDVSLRAGGLDITIKGTGLALPVVVKIGGVLCSGTAEVNASGTQITGLKVPAGAGSNLAITVSTNDLGEQTLTQTFSYSQVEDVKVSTDQGCVAAAGASSMAMLLPMLAGALALRRRRNS